MVTRDELLACGIHNWYSQFADHTFQTRILDLPDEFLAWLEEDGIILPPTSTAFPSRNRQSRILHEDDYHQDDWLDDDEEENESDTNERNDHHLDTPSTIHAQRDFSDFLSEIDAAIHDLGGAVLPKLTWSCPKDAIWITTENTLRCTTADQVLLLLKSSDRVLHDITDALLGIHPMTEQNTHRSSIDQNTASTTNNTSNASTTNSTTTNTHERVKHVLALRKWYDLKPGREFRCFVIENRLLGISQRDISRKYPELEREEDDIVEKIEDFHDVYIKNKFSLRNFTYDVYIPSNLEARVRLIDYNPLGATTSPLLFNSWEELHSLNDDASLNMASMDASGNGHGMNGNGCSTHQQQSGDTSNNTTRHDASCIALPEFRIIREDVALRPDTALYGVPYDFVDTSNGSALQSLLNQAGDAQSLWENMNPQIVHP